MFNIFHIFVPFHMHTLYNSWIYAYMIWRKFSFLHIKIKYLYKNLVISTCEITYQFLMQCLIILQQTCTHTHQFKNIVTKHNNQEEISRDHHLNTDDLLIALFSDLICDCFGFFFSPWSPSKSCTLSVPTARRQSPAPGFPICSGTGWGADSRKGHCRWCEWKKQLQQEWSAWNCSSFLLPLTPICGCSCCFLTLVQFFLWLLEKNPNK